jgi:hypothetical protein
MTINEIIEKAMKSPSPVEKDLLIKELQQVFQNNQPRFLYYLALLGLDENEVKKQQIELLKKLKPIINTYSVS